MLRAVKIRLYPNNIQTTQINKLLGCYRIEYNQTLARKINQYKEEIEFDEKILDEMINYAISNLKKAKSNHDIIESYYIPSMNFEKADELKEQLVERILKYEDK